MYVECIDTGSRFIEWAVYDNEGHLVDVFPTAVEAEAFMEGQDEQDSDRV